MQRTLENAPKMSRTNSNRTLQWTREESPKCLVHSSLKCTQNGWEELFGGFLAKIQQKRVASNKGFMVGSGSSPWHGEFLAAYSRQMAIGPTWTCEAHSHPTTVGCQILSMSWRESHSCEGANNARMKCFMGHVIANNAY